MRQQSGLGVVALGVLIAIVVLGLGYVFAVSPQLDAASAARDEHEIAIQDNDLLELQILQLQALALEVPGWQEDVDEIAAQLPPLPDTEGLHDVLIAAADANGIPWVDFRVEDVSKINTNGQSSAAPAAETAGGSGSGTEDAAAADPGAEDAGAEDAGTETETPKSSKKGGGATGLVAVQFSLTTEGDPNDVIAFLTSLYEQTGRYITVSGYSIGASPGSDPAPGRPILEQGDITFSMQGLAFVLTDPNLPFETDEEGGVLAFFEIPKAPFDPIPPKPAKKSEPAPEPSPSPSPAA